MPVVVVHQAQRVVGVLGREAEGIVRAEVAVGGRRVPRGHRDRAEGRVLVVRGDAVRLLEEDEFGDVLVARPLATASRLSRYAPSGNPTPAARAHVVGVEEVIPTILLEDKRADGDGFGGIPDEGKVDCVVCQGV